MNRAALEGSSIFLPNFLILVVVIKICHISLVKGTSDRENACSPILKSQLLSRLVFPWQYAERKETTMKVKMKLNAFKERFANAKRIAFGRVYPMLMGMAFGVVPACASGDLVSNATTIMNGIYGDILGISSVAAGICGSVCLLGLMFSKEQKNVDASAKWLKRIVLCWLGIILMASIIRYALNKTNGMAETTLPTS